MTKTFADEKLHNLNVPRKEKIAYIQKELEQQGRESFYKEGLGIVSAVRNSSLTIVSHFDVVPGFEFGFEQGDDILTSYDGILSGALDNSATNAALLHILPELKDVNILFSDLEECGFLGIKEYIRNMSISELAEHFFINLDVTYDNYGKDISVEYDGDDRLKADIVKKFSMDSSIGVQNFREEDDTTMILRMGGVGFSACLPVEGNIHGVSKTKKNGLDKYVESLSFVIESVRELI